MRIRRFAAIASAFTITVTAALGSGVPASAEPIAAAVDRNCYSGYFCVYKDSNFSTNNSMYRFNYSNNDWYSFAREIHQADSSWRNLYTRDAYVCDAGWRTTNTIHLTPGDSINYSSAANDRGVMHDWTNCT